MAQPEFAPNRSPAKPQPAISQIEHQQRRAGRADWRRRFLMTKSPCTSVHGTPAQNPSSSAQWASITSQFAARSAASHLFGGQDGIAHPGLQRRGCAANSSSVPDALGQQRLQLGVKRRRVNDSQPAAPSARWSASVQRILVRAGVLQEQPAEITLRLRHQSVTISAGNDKRGSNDS